MKFTFVRYKRRNKLRKKGSHIKRMSAHYVTVDDGQPLRLRRSLEHDRIKNRRHRPRGQIIYEGPIGRLL